MRKFQRAQIKEVIVNDEEVRFDTFGCLYCAPSSSNGEDDTLKLKLQGHVQHLEKCANPVRRPGSLDERPDVFLGVSLHSRSYRSSLNGELTRKLFRTILDTRRLNWKGRVSHDALDVGASV